MGRKAIRLAVVAALAVAPLGVLGAPAQAIGGNCSSSVERRDAFFDEYRVRASCSSLQADSKARGEIDVWGPNGYGPWFTVLNTNTYSNWVDYVHVYGSLVNIAHV